MLRLLLDECVDAPLLEALRADGHDVQRIPHAGKKNSLADAEVITMAAEQRRILISTDVSSLPAAYESYLADGNTHPGVLFGAQIWPTKLLIARARAKLRHLVPEELRNSQQWL